MSARADDGIVEPSTDIQHSASDFGGVGLLQVPTARMGEEGDLRGSGSFIEPYHRFAFSGTVMPWLEGVFRMTQITNRLYGPVSFSGGQSYRDRGIDARLRLYKEDDYLPDITLGIRDIAGTGVFDAEYLVATRRWYDLDFTVGLGWGELASGSSIPNPFKFLSSHFANRKTANSTGSFRADFFSGQTVGLFGGVEYKTPIENLTLKAEYDSNNFSQEVLGESAVIHPLAPVNVGLVYRVLPWLELSGAEERGNKFMFRVGFHTNVGHPSGAEYRPPGTPLKLEPARSPVPMVAEGEKPSADQHPLPPGSWNDLGSLGDFAARYGYRVVAVAQQGSGRRATISALRPVRADERENIGQIARAVARVTPAVDQVEIDVDQDGTERSYRFDARELERAVALSGRTDSVVRAEEASAPARPAPKRQLSELNRAIALAVFQDLEKVDLRGQSFEIHGDEAILLFDPVRFRIVPLALGKAARVVDAHAPTDVRFITLGLVQNNVEVVRVRMRRDDLEAMYAGRGSASEVLAHAEISGSGDSGPDAIENPDMFPGFTYRLRPRLRQQLNGPNGFFLYDLYAGLSGGLNLAPGLSITADVGLSLASNFSKLTLDSNSLLPHVRSDIKNYLRDGHYGLPRLQSDYITKLGQDLYGRVSVGLLEEMYGGIDGEVLYRPYGQRWAVGLDLNRVYQRGYHEQFGFRDYKVTTGRAEFYYQLPWDGITLSVNAGRYLARDWGGTFEISREFESGVRVGAFATITTVPFSKFGEGSFDKGFYISIPIDIALPFATRTFLGYSYRPLTRDGGQYVVIDKPLYSETTGYDLDHVTKDWRTLGTD